ncbi:MAG: M14 family metallopeptidase [Bacteroidales bacterium]
MKKLWIFLFLFWTFFLSVKAQDTKFLTWFEKSGGKETPRYDKTVDYCKILDKASPMLTYTSFGKSPQGSDLPLLIADQDGLCDPTAIRKKGRIILLVQACIHAGEPDGKDAGLMLLRDIAFGGKSALLKNVSILFIPIFNVDGHERFGPYNRINQNGPKEMGWRVTAQNLNLNRDFMKADTPEMQAWLKLYNTWLPEFFVDCHVTDGADYQYKITYALETFGNMDKGLTDWTRDVFETQITKEMLAKGYPMLPYVEFRNWHDPRSGLVTGVAPPMISQGYTAIQNRPGLLIEAHMLKPYAIRVYATCEMLRVTIELLNKEGYSLREIEQKADQFTASPEFRKQEMPLRFTDSETDSTIVDFFGFEYTMEKSELTGGEWFKYDTTRPVVLKVPFFDSPKVTTRCMLPEAYIIPPEWSELTDKLILHGIKVKHLASSVNCLVESYKFSNTKWQQRPYEGHHGVTFDCSPTIETRLYPEGSAVIDMNQRTAMVIAHFLEPKASDSFVSWGFFDAIFEQKEYSESYVMEVEARHLLTADPTLAVEFEKKKKEEPSFAKDPDEILNWFYSKTPYWDQHVNTYPVGRIMDRKVVESCKFFVE